MFNFYSKFIYIFLDLILNITFHIHSVSNLFYFPFFHKTIHKTDQL